MVAALEADQRSYGTPSFSNSPAYLKRGDLCLRLSPDGSVDWLESAKESRLLFGRDSVHFYKVQAGITIAQLKLEWKTSISPSSATLKSRVFDFVDASQEIGFLEGGSPGLIRLVRLKNGGPSPIRLRLLTLHDPTAANFREDSTPWGSMGVNAFNRGSHVAMDEVATPPSARVVGARPGPMAVYMTSDLARVTDLLKAGDTPESTTGTSGQIMVLMKHEFELAPQESKTILTVSVYDLNKLEAALSAFGRVGEEARAVESTRNTSCSSPEITTALQWARSSLGGIESNPNLLERAECLDGLVVSSGQEALPMIQGLRDRQGRDGALPHSLDGGTGYLETAVFLASTSKFLVAKSDRKLSRQMYASLKRAAAKLLGDYREGSMRRNGTLPVGWRRRIGKGFPTGDIAELNISVAGALLDFSRLAGLLGKGADSAKFREGAEVISAECKRVFVDESGILALNVADGILHQEQTVDQAVACSRYPFDLDKCSSIVHRLLEKDFETGWGPRTVPTSNRVYFNGRYGDGQLGGYWTRAAVSHLILAYSCGFAGIGSLGLQKVAKLVQVDAPAMGGWPGQFPYWVDVSRREVQGEGSDPVAAARMLWATVDGELGLSFVPSGLQVNPPPSSTINWILLGDIWLGEPAAAFVGRANGRVITLLKSTKVDTPDHKRFASFEPIPVQERGVFAGTFFGSGQHLCIGNSTKNPVRVTAQFQPRDSALLKSLSANVEESDGRGSWRRTATVRILSKISLDVTLESQGWKVFRLSTS